MKLFRVQYHKQYRQQATLIGYLLSRQPELSLKEILRKYGKSSTIVGTAHI